MAQDSRATRDIVIALETKLDAVISGVVDLKHAIEGNSKPGLKADVVALQNQNVELRKDVDALKNVPPPQPTPVLHHKKSNYFVDKILPPILTYVILGFFSFMIYLFILHPFLPK